MNLMGLFRSPQNELEKGGKQLKNPQEEQHNDMPEVRHADPGLRALG